MANLEFKCRKDITPRSKYAIRKLGIDVRLILPRDVTSFPGSEDERKIQYDFFNETKAELLKQIAKERDAHEKERQASLNSGDAEKEALIQRENEKFEKTCKRQNKELKQNWKQN